MLDKLKGCFAAGPECFHMEVPQSSAQIELHVIQTTELEEWLTNSAAPDLYRQQCSSQAFGAQQGQVICLMAADGQLQAVLWAYAAEQDCAEQLGKVWQYLPAVSYKLSIKMPADKVFTEASFYLAWAKVSYDFKQRMQIGKQAAAGEGKSLWLPHAEQHNLGAILQAEYAVRDLINAPANWLDPECFAEIIANFAEMHQAQCLQTIGDELCAKNYPAIHAVGRAGSVAPRLVEILWGNASAPLLTLVGKGVCFDSGGLDIKPSSGMRWMKKDMAGAAHVLGLAHLVMQAKLPVRLRVLLPVVENAIAANAYRPGDVLTMRQGTTVEVSNTDAEGRLILADALAAAAEDKPDLLVDFASLTGAARVAVGPDIIPFFASHAALADTLLTHAAATDTPMLRLPLFPAYKRYLKSTVADLKNAAETRYAGTLTAALFLQAFVPAGLDWLHFDVFAWSNNSPGQAAMQGVAAMFAAIEQRYPRG